jgi:hypothetical protein
MIDRLFECPLECANPKKLRDNPNALPHPAASTRVSNQQEYPWFDGDPIKACAALQDSQEKKGVL